MKRFTIAKLGRLGQTLLLAAVAVISFGCGGGGGGGGDNPANNNTGGTNRDSRLFCGDGEAWLQGYCESAEQGVIFKSNGDFIELNHRNDDGSLREKGSRYTWRTNGNKLIFTNARGQDVDEDFSYEISDGSMILVDDGRRVRHYKCSGLTIVGAE